MGEGHAGKQAGFDALHPYSARVYGRIAERFHGVELADLFAFRRISTRVFRHPV